MANDFVLIVEKVAYYSGKPKKESISKYTGISDIDIQSYLVFMTTWFCDWLGNQGIVPCANDAGGKNGAVTAIETEQESTSLRSWVLHILEHFLTFLVDELSFHLHFFSI